MDFLDTKTRSVKLNKDGFLASPDDWDEDIAREFAKIEGIDLTDEHWKVIFYMREYWKKYVSPPLELKLCKETGIKIERYRELFPGGLLKIACRIAGLPKPIGCL